MAQEPFTAFVKWVPDGDTLLLDTGEWVRIQGIDTPETAHKKRPAQYFAEEARASLALAAEKRTVTITPEGRDRYGRLLASVALPNGSDAATMQVEQGAAFYFPHADHSPQLQKRLLKAQISAMDAGRGFWPRILSLPAARAPWVGNKRSGRAYPGTAAKRLSPSSRVVFDDLEAVFRAGYSPARSSSPWPEED